MPPACRRRLHFHHRPGTTIEIAVPTGGEVYVPSPELSLLPPYRSKVPPAMSAAHGWEACRCALPGAVQRRLAELDRPAADGGRGRPWLRRSFAAHRAPL